MENSFVVPSHLGPDPMSQAPTIEKVLEFHQTFGHYTALSPTVPPPEVLKLRAALLVEEVAEYLAAAGFNHPPLQAMFASALDYIKTAHPNWLTETDMVEAADALGDIDYVCAGPNLAWGFPAYAIINNIHDSNMSKLGPEGKPLKDENGKTKKGPNYWAPKLLPILLKYAHGDTVHQLMARQQTAPLPEASDSISK